VLCCLLVGGSSCKGGSRSAADRFGIALGEEPERYSFAASSVGNRASGREQLQVIVTPQIDGTCNPAELDAFVSAAEKVVSCTPLTDCLALICEDSAQTFFYTGRAPDSGTLWRRAAKSPARDSKQPE